MRSNAAGSPSWANRMASASDNSPVSLRLVRGTLPSGRYPCFGMRPSLLELSLPSPACLRRHVLGTLATVQIPIAPGPTGRPAYCLRKPHGRLAAFDRVPRQVFPKGCLFHQVCENDSAGVWEPASISEVQRVNASVSKVSLETPPPLPPGGRKRKISEQPESLACRYSGRNPRLPASCRSFPEIAPRRR